MDKDWEAIYHRLIEGSGHPSLSRGRYTDNERGLGKAQLGTAYGGGLGPFTVDKL